MLAVFPQKEVAQRGEATLVPNVGEVRWSLQRVDQIVGVIILFLAVCPLYEAEPDPPLV